MKRYCFSLLALLLAAPATAQSDEAAVDTTADVPHWPERFRPHPSLRALYPTADVLLAQRTSPEARAEAAIVDPDILVPPDSTTEAMMRLHVPPAHSDDAMMQDPGPSRLGVPGASEKMPARRR